MSMCECVHVLAVGMRDHVPKQHVLARVQPAPCPVVFVFVVIGVFSGWVCGGLLTGWLGRVR